MTAQQQATLYAQKRIPALVRSLGATSGDQLTALRDAIEIAYMQGRVDEAQKQIERAPA